MSAPVSDEALGELEVVHLFTDAMPTGVSVSHTGRVFICYPKWGDEVGFTVGELRDGEMVAFPSQELNDNRSDADPERLVSVQSIVVDPADRLWMLDTGSPLFQPTEHGGPKLVCVDLTTDTVVRTILFPTDVALPTTYLNDVRFDLRRGEAGTAYITDSSDQGPNGIIVVDLASGESWRRLHEHPATKAVAPPDLRMVVEGQEFIERAEDGSTSPIRMGADGIAITADGSRLFWCPMAGRRWYSVSADALTDRSVDDQAVAATVVDEATRARERRAGDRRPGPDLRHRRRARRDPPPAARRELGDRRPRPAAAVAGHHVGGRRRAPVRHSEPAVPAGQVPRRHGRAAHALPLFRLPIHAGPVRLA